MENCCGSRGWASVERRRPTLTGQASSALRWMVPCGLLILMPKCPACFAGYFLLATGIGLSASTAHTARASLIWICIASCVVFLVPQMSRFRKRLIRSSNEELV